MTGWVFRAQFHAEKWISIGMKAAAAQLIRLSGWSMDRLSKRDWLIVAFFAFVTLGTALVILNWLLGWY